jgi:broad specificity phosphatase PhoE
MYGGRRARRSIRRGKEASGSPFGTDVPDHGAAGYRMELVFVRHGESEANRLDREYGDFYCGRWDCGLTDEGRSQAAGLRGCAAVSGADAIFSSPLRRALDTAAAFADREVITDARLTERTLGDFDGKRRSELERLPEYRKYFSEERFAGFRNSFTVSAPNGECYRDVILRVMPFLEELRSCGLRKAVVVSHFCTIRGMLNVIGNLSEEETLKIRVYQCDPIVAEFD